MVGAKYLDDFYYKNEFYARIGGISKVETNNLELKIMETFDFRLFIEEEEFNSYLTRIETYKDVNAWKKMICIYRQSLTLPWESYPSGLRKES